MTSKRNLKGMLEEISPCAKFMRFDFASPEKFRIELRCQVEKDQTMEFYVEFARSWIAKFSKFTATTWIVRNSFLKLKRLVFRKIYTCHRSAFNKRKKVDNETRNQECKAKIDFKIKLTTRNTVRYDKLLKEGLNMFILIDFVHSHKVRAAESYHLLRNMPETEEIFQKYFDMCCLASAVKSYHELTLIDKYGENCPEVFENAIVNPPLRNLIYLQEKMKKKKCPRVLSTREQMHEKRVSLKESEVDLVLSDIDTESSIIITPLMKRAIAEIGLEHVLIDSTDIPNGSTATFILIPISTGAIPIACALHGKYELNNALDLTKSHLETITGQQFYPKVIITDNLEHNAIIPSSKCFQSRYSICGDVWIWINNDDNKVDRKKRHRIMLAIKTLLYSESLEKAEKLYSELQESENVVSNTKLKEYLKILWDKKDQWMCFEDLSYNLVEISIRLLKEFITRRCKSFNDPLMIDVITNILEKHFKRILASFVQKEKTIATYTKFLIKAKVVLDFGSEVRRISANEFRIDLQSKQKYKYIYFRIDTMCCDCSQGKKGHFCEHLTAIVNIIDCEVMKAPILTEEERDLYTKIIGGEIEKAIKPDISEDMKVFTDLNDIAKHSDDDFDEDLELINDGGVPSGSSSPKLDGYDDNDEDIYAEVKTEKLDIFDPLDESNEHDPTDFVIAQNVLDDIPTTSKNSDMKRKYETVLKAVNDEFRRLNRFFSENPNASNLETMTRLARELAKIRPVEKVKLDNMFLKPNKKRQQNSRLHVRQS